MTKKKKTSSEILADENQKICWKSLNWENWEMHHCLRVGWTPLSAVS